MGWFQHLVDVGDTALQLGERGAKALGSKVLEEGTEIGEGVLGPALGADGVVEIGDGYDEWKDGHKAEGAFDMGLGAGKTVLGGWDFMKLANRYDRWMDGAPSSSAPSSGGPASGGPASGGPASAAGPESAAPDTVPTSSGPPTEPTGPPEPMEPIPDTLPSAGVEVGEAAPVAIEAGEAAPAVAGAGEIGALAAAGAAGAAAGYGIQKASDSWSQDSGLFKDANGRNISATDEAAHMGQWVDDKLGDGVVGNVLGATTAAAANIELAPMGAAAGAAKKVWDWI